jgi:hypothetical protein
VDTAPSLPFINTADNISVNDLNSTTPIIAVQKKKRKTVKLKPII